MSKELLRLAPCFALVCLAAGCSSKADTAGAPERADGGDAAVADAAAPDVVCPASRTCGSQCCDDTEVCAPDSSGTMVCQPTCSTSGTCPDLDKCCLRATPDAAALCVAPAAQQTCLCDQGSDCTTQSCAPATDSMGMPVGPYVCVADDNQPYQGCASDFGLCPSGYCCVTDAKGNEFCAKPCTTDAACGAAHCRTFDFSASRCSGMSKACGP